MADQLGTEVQFMGQNGVKQHLFSNGAGGLVTDVYTTLEEAVARFGKRIKIDSKVYAQSVNFRQGYAATQYAPRSGADRIERIEYGMGYLKRLIEGAQAAKVAPEPVDMRLPHEVLQDRMKAEKARAPQARVPQTPNPAPPTFKAPPLQTPPPLPESKDEVADRLAASRAALLAPIEPAAEEMEISDAPVAQPALTESIGNIVKRGRGRPKTV